MLIQALHRLTTSANLSFRQTRKLRTLHVAWLQQCVKRCGLTLGTCRNAVLWHTKAFAGARRGRQGVTNQRVKSLLSLLAWFVITCRSNLTTG